MEFVKNVFDDIDRFKKAFARIKYRDELFYGWTINTCDENSGICAIYDNNYLVMVGHLDFYSDFTYLYMMYVKYEFTTQVISYLTKTIPHMVISCDCGIANAESYGLKYLSNISSINHGEEYNFHSFWTNDLDENFLRDKFESLYVTMPTDEFSVSDLHFDVVNSEELRKKAPAFFDPLFYGAYGRSASGFSHVAGFCYFDYDEVNGSEMHYILATNPKTNKIVGVLKYGYWPDYPNATCVDYIDVAVGAQNRGVATALIKKMDEVKTRPNFRIGILSQCGKKHHIDQLFKAHIHNVNFIER